MSSNDQLLTDFFRLGRLVRRMGHRHIMDMDDGHLHRGQGYLLSLISENPGAKQMDLAEIMDIRPSSMTEHLVKLENSGFIERKHDEKDQRVIRIFLTDKGKEAMNMSSGSMAEMNESVFGTLSDEEKQQFHSVINKLTDALDKDFAVGFRGNRCGRHQSGQRHSDGHGHGQGQCHGNGDGRGERFHHMSRMDGYCRRGE